MHRQFLVIAFILSLAAFLWFYRLDLHLMWNDEIDVAIYAKNILTSGLPTGWDGRNLYAYRDGSVLNSELLGVLSPWLTHYLMALSFYVFGVTTWAARFPFALTGFLTLILIYFLVQKLFRDPGLAYAVLAISAFSPTLIMFSRTARYYSLTMMAAVLSLLALELIPKKKWLGILLLVISGMAMFHSNELQFVAWWTSLFISTLIFKSKSLRLTFLAVSPVVAIFTATWVLWANPVSAQVGERHFLVNTNLPNTLEILKRFAWDIHLIQLLPLPLVALYLGFALKEVNHPAKLRQPVFYLALTALLFTVFSAILSPTPLDITTHSDVRHISAIFPLLLVLFAYPLYRIFQKNRLLGAAVFIIAVFTNIFFLKPPFEFKSYAYEYVSELMHDYTTPYEAVVDHLETHARQNDTVFVDPEYATEPLLFYLGNKLYFVGVLRSDNERILGKNRAFLPERLYTMTDPPDWYIKFGLDKSRVDVRGLPQYADVDYEETVLDVFAEDYTRPELFSHIFREVRPVPDEWKIYIYHKQED